MNSYVKYIIERKDTHEWFCPNFTGYYGHTYTGEAFGEFPDKKNDWTRDANMAMQFESKQEAEDFINKMEYLHDVLTSDCEITEHEFIPAPIYTQQVCPKCNGQGIVSKPPHIPGDIHEWSSTTATSFVCNLCNGTKVVYGKWVHGN